MGPVSLNATRMLDVGCDDGSFLLAAADLYGISPVGVDVSARAVQIARSKGIQVFHGVLEDMPNDLHGFTVISAVDVLEHMANPAGFLESVKKRISPSGLLYIQTPNPASVVYGIGRILGNSTGGRPTAAIKRLFPPEHIQYFSRKGLRAIANRCGFEVVDLCTRTLLAREIAAGKSVVAALGAVQCFDRIKRSEILLCAVLRVRQK